MHADRFPNVLIWVDRFPSVASSHSVNECVSMCGQFGVIFVEVIISYSSSFAFMTMVISWSPCWQVQNLCPADKWRSNLWKGMVGYIGEVGQNGSEKMAVTAWASRKYGEDSEFFMHDLQTCDVFVLFFLQILSISRWSFLGFQGRMIVIPHQMDCKLASLTEISRCKFKHPKRFGYIHVTYSKSTSIRHW